MINLETAVDFGKTLIEYSSRVDNKVGPPSQFGLFLAVAPLVGEIALTKLSPLSISLDKILYRLT